MHTPFYRHVFKDAWQGSWRNKQLWVLGLLSAFWGVTGLQMVWDWFHTVFQSTAAMHQYRAEIRHFTPPLGHVGFSSVAAFITLVALFALLLWVVTASRAGVFWALYRAGGERAGKNLVHESLRVGTVRFWPVLIANALGRLVISAIFILLLLVVGAIGISSFWSAVGSTIIIITATLGALLIGIMTIFTTLGIVVGDMKISRALRASWQHMRRHWLVTLESVILLYLLNAAVGVFMVVAAAALALPLLMLLVVTSIVSSALSLWLVAVPIGVVILLALLLLGAWYATFEAAAWTSIYRRTEDFAPVPKIYRIAALLKAKFSR